MAKGKAPFTPEFFESKGYTFDKSTNSWLPPKFRNPFTTPENNNGEFVPMPESALMIPKQKVNASPDFEVKPVTEWFIPYQIPSKKNSRQNFVKNGRQISIPSKRYTEYKSLTKRYWEVFGLEFNQTIKRLGLSFPLDIEMTFIRTTKQRVDYFGPGESVFDLMTDFNWWPDDNHLYGKPFFGDIEVDKSNPGVRIKLITNK